jgi:membrane protease YdiL (CAAX protease family)
MMKLKTKELLSSPWLFFALTYGWSWLLWVPAALSGLSADELAAQVLIVLGGVSPMLLAVALTYITQERQGRRAYWQRAIQFGRIKLRWYAVIFLTVPLLTVLAALLDVLLGGSGGRPEAMTRFLSQPLAILPFAIFMLFFGPVPEELGWRGYALDRLQMKWNALRSSVILGAVWALWHLPLFFVDGTYQNGLGVGTLSFWIFMLEIIPKSILITWIFNNTRRSTLSAVLLHFMDNFTGELFELTARAELYQFMLWIAASIVVTAVWGPKTLTLEHADG